LVRMVAKAGANGANPNRVKVEHPWEMARRGRGPIA
jgi:hypothetical protein